MKTITRLLILPILFLSIEIQAQEYCFQCEGNHARAYKSSAFGIGNCIESSAQYSSAFGLNNYVSGESSAVFGDKNSAKGICSFVMGWKSQSLENFSTVIGNESTVNGAHSFVIGFKSKVSFGDYGYIFGSNCVLPAGNGFLIGNRLMALTGNTFIIGDGGMNDTLTNDLPYSLNIGFKSSLPTLHVGPSAASDRTGKIGIGNVTSPTAKLHIRADAVENASLFLQPSDWDSKYALVKLGTSGHFIKADKNDGMTFKSEKDFLFTWDESGDGNVYRHILP